MTGTAGAAADTAQLMDGIYRHQRHIYDLTRKYYLLGRDRLIAQLTPPPGGRVLEIGCGTGRNLIAAARAYPAARFYGVDISEAMLATASANIAKAGLGDRIDLAQGDAADFDAQTLFGCNDFDRVFISYSLSMIPPWQGALACALRHTAADGRLLAVDFGAQQGLPTTFRRLLRAWLALFHVEPRAELCEVIEQLARNNHRPGAVHALYRGYAALALIGPEAIGPPRFG